MNREVSGTGPLETAPSPRLPGLRGARLTSRDRRTTISNRTGARPLRMAAALAATSALALLPGAPARSAPEPVEPGSALAVSQVISAKIVYGGFALPLRLAASGASYTDSAAQATTQGIDGGTVAGATAAGSCSSSAASPTQRPPLAALTADSTGGAQHKTTGALPIGAGEVDARPDPLAASSRTDLVALAVPALLKVSGSSTAAVSYDEGRLRTATATVATTVSLANGLVSLSGLTWDATQHSGERADDAGGFSLVSVTVAGRTYKVASPDQLTTAINAANSALKILGISLEVPALGKSGSTTTVPPLTIRISGSPALGALIQPLLQLKAPLQDALSDLFSSVDNCALAQLATLVGTVELVADVVLAALAGEGSIEIGIGGVSVSTAPPPEFQNPFDGSGPADGGGTPAGKAPHATASAGTAPAAAAAPAAPAVAAVPPIAAAPGTLSPAVPVSTRITCVSANPADKRPCSSGAEPRLLGLLLLAALALFGADLYQGRRRRPIVRRSHS